MATATHLATPSEDVRPVERSFLSRAWKALFAGDRVSARDARTPLATEGNADSLELTFPARIRKFVWLSSGLFSAASFAMPALGIFALGSVSIEGIGARFLAGIVSACVFGVTSVLHFGPDEA